MLITLRDIVGHRFNRFVYILMEGKKKKKKPRDLYMYFPSMKSYKSKAGKSKTH